MEEMGKKINAQCRKHWGGGGEDTAGELQGSKKTTQVVFHVLQSAAPILMLP